ncbi:MAG: hypothetical protein NC222_06415 [Staphylococcus sp.]|nr:hypothetical protein [Staphylococcus sp.]
MWTKLIKSEEQFETPFSIHYYTNDGFNNNESNYDKTYKNNIMFQEEAINLAKKLFNFNKNKISRLNVFVIDFNNKLVKEFKNY